MKSSRAWLALCLVFNAGPGMTALLGAPASPFEVTATLATTNHLASVVFQFGVPPEHVIYSDRLAFETEEGQALKPAALPQAVLHRDALTGQERLAYDHSFSASVTLPSELPLNVIVKLQGCSNSACYFPERHRFQLTSQGIVVDPPSPANPNRRTEDVMAAAPDLNGFKVVASGTGYIPKKAFVEFLARARSGEAASANMTSRLAEMGLWMSLLLILIGGIGLNLTPCVLPLIPINLAIIGAGAQAGSRRRGFTLGAAYGSGMALVYGLLGLVVVVTGAKFGSLNSSGWFNLGIAMVFVVLALAMFDKVNIDFSRFQRGGGPGSARARGQMLLALGMGGMAALLAGACVAPVVISVLLMAANLYGKGIWLALLLPFVLGLGMALPWPFAGAGLSFLPKPGKWMKWVKYSFGVLILVFAAYYGHLGFDLLSSSRTLIVSAKSNPASPASPNPESALATVLEQARAQNRPVLIDFAASWCKNCLAMESAVLPAPEVRRQLEDFVVFKYPAEKPNESPAREILDRFGVIGLPTYVVLKPDN